MKKYIPILMEIYSEMNIQNKKRKDIYEKKKKEITKPYIYPDISDRIYSDTMLHNIIVIINKLNNQ